MRASFALVTQPVLDLRRRPDHRAELGSQLLLGEVVRLHGRRAVRGWLAVESLEDGYRGWVKDWGLIAAGPGRVRAWRRGARHVVRAPLAIATAGHGGASLGPLPWMARIRVSGRTGSRSRIVLPDGRRGSIPTAAIALRGEWVPGLGTRVASLLGAPYLWGGRTMLGLDCSGLIQLVMAERGIRLPRDADQQWRACRPLEPEEAVAGDLLFFSSRPGGGMEHVGILLGGGLYVHARGVVRINSVRPRNALFDKLLCRQIRAVGRPIPSRLPGSGTGSSRPLELTRGESST